MKEAAFLLVFTLQSLLALTQPQHFYYQALGVDDGLSQSTIYNFLQDKKGRLWIGTGDGLDLYDGYNVRVFKSIPGKKFSIPHKIVRTLAEDKLGRIWVGTDRGITIIDLEKDTAINLFITDQVSYPLCANDSVMICQVLSKGLKSVDIYNYQVSDAPMGMVSKPYLERVGINQSHRCIYTSAGDLYYKSGDGPWQVFDPALGNEKIWNVYPTEGKIYLAGIGVLAVFDSQTAKTKRIEGFQNKQVKAVYVDNNQNIWASVVAEGIYILDRDGRFIQKLGPEYMTGGQEPISLSFADIFFEDKDKNLWVGTDGSGACVFPLGKRKFKHFTKAHENLNSLPGKFIKCFYASGDTTWIGTLEDGLVLNDRKKGTFKAIPVLGRDGKNVPVSAISGGINPKELLLGTKEGLYSCKMGIASKLKVEGMPDNETVFSLYSHASMIWLMGTYEGLYHLRFDGINFSAEKLITNSCPYVFDAGTGKLAALVRYRGLVFTSPGVPKPEIEPFDTAIINWSTHSIIYHPNDDSYLATSSGLVKLDKNLKISKIYGIEDGLPDLLIYGILEDQLGRLWMSTNKGISCFEPKKEGFTNYGLEDGIQSNEFNTGAFYQNDGLFYFGGINGFNVFDPLEIMPDSSLAPILLTKFLLNDEPEANRALSTFNYKQNTLSFEVASPAYVGQDKMEYAFYLEGLDEHWYMAGNSRFVRYASLPPGSYKLVVKAKNAYGVWSQPIELKPFTILKPFWLRWWFIALVVLAFSLFVGSIVYLVLKNKHQKEMAELKRQKEIQEIRTRISRDIHDELGADLTKISLKAQLINKKVSDIDPDTQTELSKLSENSRGLTKSLGDIVWSVNPSHDNLQSTVAFLYSYLVEMADNASIDLETNLGGTFPEVYLHPEKRRSIVLVVKEAFNNLTKYSKATKARVWLELAGDELRLNITDNGTGFNIVESVEKGVGLRSMEKRIASSGGKFSIESIEGQGTSIKIRLLLPDNQKE